MAYVDLNPIRAGTASTPEDSEFTSIYDGIKEMRLSALSPARGIFLLTHPSNPFVSPNRHARATVV